MSPTDLYAYVKHLEAVLCLVSFIVGLYFRWWVMGPEFERMEKNNADLRAQAKLDAETIQKSVHTTWQLVGTVRDTVRPPSSGG